MRDLGMIKAVSGFLATLTLLASGIGGVLFGFIADRIGRKRALMLSILTYSVCSFASGLSTSIDRRRRSPALRPGRAPWLLMILGIITAFFGTGFFSGSGLIGSEIFPTPLRARALGFTYNGARTMSSIAPLHHRTRRPIQRPKLSLLPLRR